MKPKIIYLFLFIFLTTWTYGKDHPKKKQPARSKKKVVKKIHSDSSGLITVPATSTSPSVDIYYTSQGKGPTTLVFLPGYLNDHHIWKCQLPLSSQFKVVTLDLRGYGNSERVGPFSLENYVHDLSFILDALKIQNPVLIGYSQGAIIALSYAATFPDKLSKLVIVHGTPVPVNRDCSGDLPTTTNAWCEGMDPAFISTTAASFRTYMPIGANGIASRVFNLEKNEGVDSVMKGLPQPSEVSDGETAAEILEQFFPPIDLRLALSNIKTQTLIIGGCRDGFFKPLSQFYMRQYIKNSKIVMFSRAHNVHLLNVSEFNQLVKDFVQGRPIQENFGCDALGGPCNTCY